MIKQARLDESNIIAQKGGVWDSDGEWAEFSNDIDFVGSLAQQAVSTQFKLWGFLPEETPFFNPDINNDQFDFLWLEERLDVKGSSTAKGFPDVYPNSRFLRTDHKCEKDIAKIDRYVFVKVNYQDKVAIIAGTIRVRKFWAMAKKCEGMSVTTPSHYILAKNLESFKKFVFAV